MFERNWRKRAFTMLSAVAAVLGLTSPATSQETLGSNVNVLVGMDFSGDYITPRGLHVEDEGLVWQPLVLMLWKLHAADQGLVRDVTLTTGIWNSFHSQRAGATPSRWNEVDPILGLGIKLQGGWAVDAGMTAFYTPTDSYLTSTHLDLKLTYNDSFLGGVSLNPYVAYWVELNNKSTVVFDPSTSQEGSYLTLGATPVFALGATGTTLEVGTYANFVSSSFYQRMDGTDGGSGLGIFSVSPKLSVPLKFFGVSHGAWTAYVTGSYFRLSNDGVMEGNQLLSGESVNEPNLTRFRGGLTVFF
jgi:hypothetical protein